MNKKVILLFLVVLPLVFFAQRRNRYKYEFVGSVGATGFLGDLGGSNQVGTHLLKDLDFQATRFAMGASVRRRFSNYLSAKANLYFATVNGSDENTEEPFRRNRNLNFRAQMLEFSVQGEFYLIKERGAHLYRINNVRQPKKAKYQLYVFAGVGFIYFRNQGFNAIDQKWHDLRALHTEGQGLPNGSPEYQPFTLVLPGGIGWRYNIDRKWSVGIEYGMRKTFSDYIDDVGGNYYADKAGLEKAYGPAAVQLADPSIVKFGYGPAGEKRGEGIHKDAYMFALVNVNYKILYRKKTRSKF